MAACGKMIFAVGACLLVLLPVSIGLSCQDAESYVTVLKSSSNVSCLKRLNQMSNLTKLIDKASSACDSAKNKSIHDEVQAALNNFYNQCKGPQGCSNILDLYSGLMSECLVSDDHMTDMLNDAVNDWNRKGNNATVKNKVKTTVQCIEQKVRGCSLLRKAYGQIYQDYPQLGLLQQTLGIYKEINGDDPSSPVISDCDGDPSEIVKEISRSCQLKIDRDKNEVLIINYCVWMQEQIDCVLGWEKTCPVAVTKFLSPFMDSYSVTHLKFCNNITIHGLMFRPLNKVCYDTYYNDVYKNCWSKFMTAIDDGYTDFTGEALVMFFRLSTLKPTVICGALKGQQLYSAASMKTCTGKHTNECQLLFPTHGNRTRMSDDLLQDPDVYNQLMAGPTPFNEYGVTMLELFCEKGTSSTAVPIQQTDKQHFILCLVVVLSIVRFGGDT